MKEKRRGGGNVKLIAVGEGKNRGEGGKKKGRRKMSRQLPLCVTR